MARTLSEISADIDRVFAEFVPKQRYWFGFLPRATTTMEVMQPLNERLIPLIEELSLDG